MDFPSETLTVNIKAEVRSECKIWFAARPRALLQEVSTSQWTSQNQETRSTTTRPKGVSLNCNNNNNTNYRCGVQALWITKYELPLFVWWHNSARCLSCLVVLTSATTQTSMKGSIVNAVTKQETLLSRIDSKTKRHGFESSWNFGKLNLCEVEGLFC